MKEKKFVLDANIWISMIIGRQLSFLIRKIEQNKLTILTCKELIIEIREVLNRSKFKKYMTADEIQEAIIIHLKISKKYNSLFIRPFFIDADDDYLLALAEKGKANYIVTGDKGILNAAQVGGIEIISFHTFLKMLG